MLPLGMFLVQVYDIRRPSTKIYLSNLLYLEKDVCSDSAKDIRRLADNLSIHFFRRLVVSSDWMIPNFSIVYIQEFISDLVGV